MDKKYLKAIRKISDGCPYSHEKLQQALEQSFIHMEDKFNSMPRRHAESVYDAAHNSIEFCRGRLAASFQSVVEDGVEGFMRSYYAHMEEYADKDGRTAAAIKVGLHMAAGWLEINVDDSQYLRIDEERKAVRAGIAKL